MYRAFALVLGGMILVIALFIPVTDLRDSGIRKARKSAKASTCSPFKTPQAPVGHYVCSRNPKKLETYYCRLICPSGMKVRSNKNRFLVRCHKGRWSSIKTDAHCVAAVSVDLVEQQLASPVLINKLLTSYLKDSYDYLTMAYFFDRADVQLPGFHKFFLGLWQSSLGMARDVMAYINKRGGWIDLKDLPRSNLAENLRVSLRNGRVGLAAMETALDIERSSQRLATFLVKRVRKQMDPHLEHFLKGEHLTYKVKIIKQLMDYITRLRSFGDTELGEYELGEYEMDNALQ